MLLPLEFFNEDMGELTVEFIQAYKDIKLNVSHYSGPLPDNSADFDLCFALHDRPLPASDLIARSLMSVPQGIYGGAHCAAYCGEKAGFDDLSQLSSAQVILQPGERDLATFPLFSLFGPALGMASIVPDMDASKPIEANPAHIFAAIEKYQCSNLFANPALIEVLGQAASAKGKPQLTLTSLQRVISAGAPATLPSIQRFIKLLNPNVQVLTSYGATESLPLTKIASDDLLQTTDITDNGGGICVGEAIDGVEVSIIDITEQPIANWQDALALPVNTIGEIVVKGAMVSRDYYHRESATKQAKIQDKSQVRHRMGDLGYIDEHGRLWMCGRKAHRVDTDSKRFFSIPCERIFNVHEDVKRTALVAVTLNNRTLPLLCVELTDEAKENKDFDVSSLFSQLKVIALNNKQTAAIAHFLIHDKFPVDIRHNAKIFREKLAVWAQAELEG